MTNKKYLELMSKKDWRFAPDEAAARLDLLEKDLEEQAVYRAERLLLLSGPKCSLEVRIATDNGRHLYRPCLLDDGHAGDCNVW